MKRKVFDLYNNSLAIYNAQSRECSRYLWLAIAIANYLTAVRREKIAVVELAGGNALEQLAWNFNRNIRYEKYFDLFGVKYYPYYDETILSEIMGENYNHIIFDGVQLFGNRRIDRSKYRKCILTGSLKPWESEDYGKCLEKLSNEDRLKDHSFLAEFFDYKDVKHIEKEKGLSLIQLPVGMNPFRIKRTEFQFFESFL